MGQGAGAGGRRAPGYLDGGRYIDGKLTHQADNIILKIIHNIV